ncbi:phage tail protein [Pedobacter sp. KBW06]|uniref:phage tail protein n=1 Tax=Pedobacter sp. KBW06 TaxID=2153359 RepID=UPI000F5984A0|nr:phage tail protein [Pedobacter sp. KBW06]RQO66358.1 phage tail protein [Pedobacter sp. KBW06]
MATDPKKNYPLPKFHFQLDWGGTRIGFTEVSGLDFETEVIEYREGSSPTYNKTKQPGLTKYANVVLKRGTFLGDFEFFEQWKKTMMFQEGKEQFRRDVTIRLLDEEHQPVISWTLSRAWPSKVQSTNLKSDANEVAIETIELVHEGLSIVEAKK